MPASTTLEFTLAIGDLPPETFRVLHFDLEESLSRCFVLRIRARGGADAPAPATILGRPATLTVAGADFTVARHGLVTAFETMPAEADAFGSGSTAFGIRIEPRLSALDLTVQSRIFQGLDLPGIVAAVLDAAGWAKDDFRFESEDAFPVREFTVQYEESDRAFLERLLADEGVPYYFDHMGEKEIWVLADAAAAAPALPHTPVLPYRPHAGLGHLDRDHVTAFAGAARLVPGKVTVKDYNYRAPDTPVAASAGADGQGEIYRYGLHTKTADEAGRRARILAEEWEGRAFRITGGGVCRDFRPGYRFTLDGPQPAQGEFVLVSVVHAGDQREGFEGGDGDAGLIYSSTFEALPAGQPLRPPQDLPKPRIPGILTAVVDGQPSRYAYLDEQGRYRMKLPFDRSGAKDGEASRAVRLAQPYAGPGYGMHFPLHAGTEIAVAFVGGDPDRPIALGAVPNPGRESPVKSGNKSQNLIRSHAGHELCLEDLEGRTGMRLATAGGHALALDDTAEARAVRLRTAGAHALALDDQGGLVSLTTAGGHSLELDDGRGAIRLTTKDGHHLVLDDQGKGWELRSRDGHGLRVDDGGGRITLSDAGGKAGLEMDLGGGTVTINARNGINLQAGQASLALNADGTVALGGVQVQVDGKAKASLRAPQVDVSGDAQLTLSATRLSAEGKAMASLQGALVNVQATGVATIAGATIKLN